MSGFDYLEVAATGSVIIDKENKERLFEHLDGLEAENAKLLWLVNDMCECFRIGAERDGVSKQWCYELFDTYTRKLRELRYEV